MPWEIDTRYLCDVLMVVWAYQQRRLDDWKRTRRIAYVIAAVNRDPKKPFPQEQKFMPLPGDEQAMKERFNKRKAEYEERKKRLANK